MKNNVREFYTIVNSKNEYFAYIGTKRNVVWTGEIEEARKYVSLNDLITEYNYCRLLYQPTETNPLRGVKAYKVKVETSFECVYNMD